MAASSPGDADKPYLATVGAFQANQLSNCALSASEYEVCVRLLHSQMSLRQKDFFFFLNVALLTINVFMVMLLVKLYKPSDHFRRLDLNTDGYLTLQEWMVYYGPHDHSWAECSGRDFQPADCDGDLRLSWREYHSARFSWRYCDNPRSPFSEWSFKRPVRNPKTGTYVFLPPERLPPRPPQDPMGTAQADNLPDNWPPGGKTSQVSP